MANCTDWLLFFHLQRLCCIFNVNTTTTRGLTPIGNEDSSASFPAPFPLGTPGAVEGVDRPALMWILTDPPYSAPSYWMISMLTKGASNFGVASQQIATHYAFHLLIATSSLSAPQYIVQPPPQSPHTYGNPNPLPPPPAILISPKI